MLPCRMAALAAGALPTLTPTRRGYYDERAAIREYDGGQPREYAEAEAWRAMMAAIERK